MNTSQPLNVRETSLGKAIGSPQDTKDDNTVIGLLKSFYKIFFFILTDEIEVLKQNLHALEQMNSNILSDVANVASIVSAIYSIVSGGAG